MSLSLCCVVVPLTSLRAFTPAYFFFFFNATAPSEIYTLSLHDALPIYLTCSSITRSHSSSAQARCGLAIASDRKSTRLNSSDVKISYAVFCLKKKTAALLFLVHPVHVEAVALISSRKDLVAAAHVLPGF